MKITLLLHHHPVCSLYTRFHPRLIHSYKSLCSLVQDSSTHNKAPLCRGWPGRRKSQVFPTLHSRKQMCTGSYHSKDHQQLQDHSWADKWRRPTRHLQVHGRKIITDVLFKLKDKGCKRNWKCDSFHPCLPGTTWCRKVQLNTAGMLCTPWGAPVAEVNFSQRKRSQTVSSAALSKSDLTGTWEYSVAGGSHWSRQHLWRDGSDAEVCWKIIKCHVEGRAYWPKMTRATFTMACTNVSVTTGVRWNNKKKKVLQRQKNP